MAVCVALLAELTLMTISALKYFGRGHALVLLAILGSLQSLHGQGLPPEAPVKTELTITLSDFPTGLGEVQISYPVLAGQNYFVESRDCLDPQNPDCPC